MSRIFLPLAVDFDDDEKVARFARYTKPGEARALRDLLVACWRYCKREKSDGHVPAEIIGKLAYPDTARIGQRDIGRLIDCGLAERTPTGYYFPGFLKQRLNKSRAELDAESAAKSAAGKKGGEAKANGKQSAKQPASTLPNESKQPAKPFPSQRQRQSQSQSSETEVVQDLGGERLVTLHAVDATEPTCSKHPLGDAGDACGGCGKVRTWRDRNDARAQRDAEHRRSKALLDEIAATRAAAVPRPKETTQ